MKYNSLDLPAIPSTVYPYSHMTQQVGLVYLHNADKLCYVETGLTDVMKRPDDEYFHLYEWVIALTEEDAEREAELYPGLNTSTWTLITENENTNFIAAGLTGPFWTNTDLYDQDGNLFLKASLPFCSRSFWLGVALGLAGKGLPKMEKQPIGYLYGHVAKEGETPTHPNINGKDYVGVVLWDIERWYTPELQKEYPYVHIFYIPSSDKYNVYCSNAELWKTDSNNEEYDCSYVVKGTKLGGTKFGICAGTLYENGENVTNPISIYHQSIPALYFNEETITIWTSYGIYNDEGDPVNVHATPIPIYE